MVVYRTQNGRRAPRREHVRAKTALPHSGNSTDNGLNKLIALYLVFFFFLSFWNLILCDMAFMLT